MGQDANEEKETDTASLGVMISRESACERESAYASETGVRSP